MSSAAPRAPFHSSLAPLAACSLSCTCARAPRPVHVLSCVVLVLVPRVWIAPTGGGRDGTADGCPPVVALSIDGRRKTESDVSGGRVVGLSWVSLGVTATDEQVVLGSGNRRGCGAAHWHLSAFTFQCILLCRSTMVRVAPRCICCLRLFAGARFVLFRAMLSTYVILLFIPRRQLHNMPQNIRKLTPNGQRPKSCGHAFPCSCRMQMKPKPLLNRYLDSTSLVRRMIINFSLMLSKIYD